MFSTLALLVVLTTAVASTPTQYQSQSFNQGNKDGFAGTCQNDGFYMMGKRAFIICSNGNAYVQSCAPGTENSGKVIFQMGMSYSMNAFCDVNLVDQQSHGSKSTGQESTSYGQKTQSSGYEQTKLTGQAHQQASQAAQPAGYGQTQQSSTYGQTQESSSQTQQATGYGHNTQSAGYEVDQKSAGYGEDHKSMDYTPTQNLIASVQTHVQQLANSYGQSTKTANSRQSTGYSASQGSALGYGQMPKAQVAGYGQNQPSTGTQRNPSAGYGQNVQSASNQQNAQSASYGQNQPSASYGQNTQAAGYGQNQQSAGYGQNHQSAGYGQNQQSAGYAQNQQSNSYGQRSHSASNGLNQQSSGYGQNAGQTQTRYGAASSIPTYGSYMYSMGYAHNPDSSYQTPGLAVIEAYNNIPADLFNKHFSSYPNKASTNVRKYM